MLPNAQSPNFVSALREARVGKNMSQRQLSLAAGFHYGTVSLYERGVHKPEPESWKKLNDILFADSDGSVLHEVGNEADAEVTLSEATVEAILDELKGRGFTKVTLANG
ncbi:helix-turn-helix transcriptional regulator [Pseudomonas sp. TH04]|uniref:helix-turn-helix domain-containing protein n=1 Tax=Pseudomonas sp. TH04 TaxID=2796370 RepID=UPI001912F02E|nr:helix-turn-helix domain-containing protein [Pseudomonas sp. TH04]MBK5543303.1 helix-turn-helix transcriptional regulator [Pseudomonas sp. TH04]